MPDRSARRPFWLRPRWLAGHLLVLTLVALFVSFGLWQLRRLEGRRAETALVEARRALPERPYAELAAEPEGGAEGLEHRRVVATGRYDPQRELLLRSRSYRGEPGWHVLTPLRLEDGGALLVDRGWVPYRLDDPPVAEAAPPAGLVEVRGRLRAEQDPAEGPLARLGARDPAEGPLEAVFLVDVERLQREFPYGLEPVYLELASQRPPQEGLLPVPPEPAALGAGPHLSYAVQWFSFAAIGVIGYALLMRRVARDEREGDAAARPTGPGRT